jgi:hypothetical protein
VISKKLLVRIGLELPFIAIAFSPAQNPLLAWNMYVPLLLTVIPFQTIFHHPDNVR